MAIADRESVSVPREVLEGRVHTQSSSRRVCRPSYKRYTAVTCEKATRGRTRIDDLASDSPISTSRLLCRVSELVRPGVQGSGQGKTVSIYSGYEPMGVARTRVLSTDKANLSNPSNLKSRHHSRYVRRPLRFGSTLASNLFSPKRRSKSSFGHTSFEIPFVKLTSDGGLNWSRSSTRTAPSSTRFPRVISGRASLVINAESISVQPKSYRKREKLTWNRRDHPTTLLLSSSSQTSSTTSSCVPPSPFPSTAPSPCPTLHPISTTTEYEQRSKLSRTAS